MNIQKLNEQLKKVLYGKSDEEQVDEAYKQKNEAVLDTSYEKAISDIKRGCATLMSDFRKLRDFEKFNYEKDTHKAIIARLEKFAHLMTLLSNFDTIDFEEDGEEGIADTPKTREFYKKLKALVESAQKNEGVHFGQPNVDKCYNELMDISFQEMKKRNGKELSDKEFEAFRPTLLKKYPKEVVDYCYMKANEDFKTQEPAQKNQSLDVQALKEYLAKENSRALNIAYNDDFTESNRSYYKGKATAIHKIQTKFNL